MRPWPSGSAASWAGRSSSTGAPAPSAPGTACPRAVATWSSASRSTRGRRAAWPGACPMPAPSSGWWSHASGRGHPLAGRPPRQAGRDRGRHRRRSPRRTTRRPVPDSRGAARSDSRPRSSTPRSSTPTSPPGICTSIPKLALRLVARVSCPASAGTWPWRSGPRMRQLLVEINRALAQLAESGELRKIYAEHGVPFRPPFTATDRGRRPHRRTPGGGSASAASWSSAWTRPTCLIRPPGTTARASTSSWRGPWPSGCI